MSDNEVTNMYQFNGHQDLFSVIEPSNKSNSTRNLLFDDKNGDSWARRNNGVTLSWSDLSVYIKCHENKLCGWSRAFYKRIISNVSGAILPGTLVAMMGPSGAGKSTIMTALAHRYEGGVLVDGDIRVNGKKVDDSMCYLSGFMYQEDIFVGALTVREHLYFMANLKMDRRTSTADKKNRVSHLIVQLGLSSCAGRQIGGLAIDGEKIVLSGGERKRLSFATECLTDPPILFCDEPTTGLDSFSAQMIVQMMRDMTQKGSNKTILCTIHQPSPELLQMFHNVILVAEGTIVYNGSSNGAIEFFQTEGYTMGKLCTPGEFLVNTLAPTPGSELSTQAAVKRLSLQFALSEQAKTNDMVIKYEQQVAKDFRSSSPPINHKPPLWISKFYWLWFRSVLEIIRNPNIQWIKIFQKLIVGLMVGFCYLGTVELTQNGLQSVQGVLFLLVTENTFAPMYAALSYFPVQFPMFIREYKNAVYSPFLFYITSILSQFPGLVVEAVLFSTCVYWMAGLQLTAYAYLMTMLISILCINVSAACGTMFSAAFNTPSTAMAYLIPFDYVVMITSGLFIKLSTLPEVIGWIKYLSWFMYSYESLTITQWGGIYNISCIENRPYLPCLETGADVIEKFSFSEDNLDLDILAMLGLYFGFLAIGYIFFKFKIKKQP